MEGIYCAIVALTNCAAYEPIIYAQQHGRRVDAIILAVAAICSTFFHVSPVSAPSLHTELLWLDRVAAITAAVHFFYFFGAACPYDFKRALKATGVMAVTGLFALFFSDVLLGGRPSFGWCVFHCIWHVCAFFTAKRLQVFIYRVESK